MELEPIDKRPVGEPLQPPLSRRHGATRVEVAVQLARENVVQACDEHEHFEVEIVRLERARRSDARALAHAMREVNLDQLAEAFARTRRKDSERASTLRGPPSLGCTSRRPRRAD